MNKQHLVFCSSDEWAEAVKKYIIPGALDGVDLGEDVLEVGPGPGRTTDELRHMTKKLTAVEIDEALAQQLAARMDGSNVTVVNADATKLPFPDDRFSGAVSFTMLHHVPSEDEQNRLFEDVRRVLRPGATFAAVDSLDSEAFRAMHVDDICVPLVAEHLEARLKAAGFANAVVDKNPYVIQFRATA